LWTKVVRFDRKVRVLPRVGEAAQLLEVVGLGPVELPARGASLKGGVQEDEDIRMRDALPHVWDVGMLLRDVAAAESQGLERVDEGRLAGSAWSDNADEELCMG